MRKRELQPSLALLIALSILGRAVYAQGAWPPAVNNWPLPVSIYAAGGPASGDLPTAHVKAGWSELPRLPAEANSPVSASPYTGLWVWQDVIPERARAQLFRFAREERVTALWVESEHYLLDNPVALLDFTAVAHDNGFETEWLLGYAPWALAPQHGQLLALVQIVLDSVAAAPPSQRPTGLHLDVEPHTLPEWSSDLQDTAAQYLDLLAEVDAAIAGVGDPLRLTVDIPSWYDAVTVTWNSRVKPLSEHVLDVVDRVALMDYRDHAWGNDGLVQQAQDEIAYATQHGKQVVIGVQTNPPDGQPEKITFYEEGRRVLRSELAATRNYFADEPGFAGVAIHDYGGLMRLQQTLGVAAWMPMSWDVDAAYSSFYTNRGQMDELMPFQYAVEADGSLRPYVPVDPSLIANARAAGLMVLPTVANNFDPAPVSAIINDPSLMALHINNILNEVLAWGFDGIDIDYENLEPADREAFSAFIRALATALHDQGKYLSLAVHPKTKEPGSWNGPQAQDYAALGRVVDRFRVMVYNFSWPDSPPGPIAPLDWAEAVLNYTTSVVDPALVWLGVPFYGWDWSNGSATSVTHAQARSLLSAYGVTPNWQFQDSQGLVLEPWFTYQEGATTHEVWYSNGRSVHARLRLAQKFDLAGIATWRLGGEDPANWATIAALRAYEDQPADLDVDGRVTVVDVQTVTAHWGSQVSQPGYSIWCDLNGDGRNDVLDVVQVGQAWHLR